MIHMKKGFSVVKKSATSQMLENFFDKHKEYNGELYVANISITTGKKDSYIIDALWISEEYGVIAFDLVEGKAILENKSKEQDFIYDLIEGKLAKYPELKQNRKLVVVPQVVTYAPSNASSTRVIDGFIATSDDNLKNVIDNLAKWNSTDKQKYFSIIISALQGISNINTKSKRKIDDSKSKGYILENNLKPAHYTLDASQASAVYNFKHNLQRIRGLAGSGKTIILAMKAAIMHEQEPEWLIGVTFNTRSLKQQFKELIGNIYWDRNGEEPNWEKIRIINAWGSSKDGDNEKGIYYDTCIEHGLEFFDFRKAENYKAQLQRESGQKLGQTFEIICQKVLDETQGKNIEKYDAILVDEAQDLSEAFLNLCYKRLKKEKRLIYAYDELQNLNESSALRNPKTFLDKKELEFDDEILKVCYRNSRPLLTTAHSLGFGIYRTNQNRVRELVQFFDDSKLWSEVGYQEKNGNPIIADTEVVLCRTEESSPKYLESHSDIDDLIVFKVFSTKETQAKWVADEIEKNIKDDLLLHKDIMVINPLSFTTKSEISMIRTHLLEKGINSHISGEHDADTFFIDNSIVLTGINRAKGNEVPMVYIINAHDCYEGFNQSRDLMKKRNILFTAITRSKAWVRVCGTGSNMEKLIKEYEKVKKNNFELRFLYPNQEKINEINTIHRDISESEKQQINNESNVLENVLDMVAMIKTKKRQIEDYPPKFHDTLRLLINSAA
jgi:superfamily I DNA and RNA helicase